MPAACLLRDVQAKKRRSLNMSEGVGWGALYGEEGKPELRSGKGLYGEEGDQGPSMGTPSPHPVNRIIDTHD